MADQSPPSQSVLSSGTVKESQCARLVIWHKIKSAPGTCTNRTAIRRRQNRTPATNDTRKHGPNLMIDLPPDHTLACTHAATVACECTGPKSLSGQLVPPGRL